MIVMSDIPEVNEIMTETYAQQVMIMCETQMHNAPWLFEDEGWDKSRLKAAVALVLDGKVVEQADGWVVQGTTPYLLPRDTLTCPCKAAQHGSKSKVCKHRVAVELYCRVQQAYPQTTLALPPVTIDERVAAPGAQEPRGAHMPADESIPEPTQDSASVAVLDATHGMSHDTPLATPLASALVQWSAQRQVVKEFLRRELHEGTDFYTLQIRGKATKPSLSKAGAEKFLGLLQLQASFAPDLGTWEMLGKPTDQILYVCQLRTRSGEIVGEGRGARSLKQDGGDINKALKMSEKSALIDAVLRTGALSDAFTQDLENEEAPPAHEPAQAQRGRIWAIVQERAPEVKTREAVESWIKEKTGLELHPDQYAAILSKLRA